MEAGVRERLDTAGGAGQASGPEPQPSITCELPGSGTQTELEAAVFRRLVGHLRKRSDVQNIDMMNLAGFCRNCLSRWYEEEARERGVDVDRPRARELVYGMPYDEWKRLFQTAATPEQRAAFEALGEEEAST